MPWDASGGEDGPQRNALTMIIGSGEQDNVRQQDTLAETAQERKTLVGISCESPVWER